MFAVKQETFRGSREDFRAADNGFLLGDDEQRFIKASSVNGGFIK